MNRTGRAVSGLDDSWVEMCVKSTQGIYLFVRSSSNRSIARGSCD
jgi:hypothetical protein